MSLNYRRVQMFLFHLSMPTDSVLRRARVRIFNALKSQTRVKSYMENPFFVSEDIFVFYELYLWKSNLLYLFFYISFLDKRSTVGRC